jgi:hypothetical protein
MPLLRSFGVFGLITTNMALLWSLGFFKLIHHTFGALRSLDCFHDKTLNHERCGYGDTIRVNRFGTRDSVGGTATDATGTVALLWKSPRIGDETHAIKNSWRGRRGGLYASFAMSHTLALSPGGHLFVEPDAQAEPALSQSAAARLG